MSGAGRDHRSRWLHREVNERIAELTTAFALDVADDMTLMVFCECGREGCMTPVGMTLSEFEQVRGAPDRWVVSSAHTDELAGSVLASRNGYALIQHDSGRLSTEAPAPRKESTSPTTAPLSRH